MPQQRKQCNVEGCELHHCRKCGGHYDPACAEGRDVCDECQINAAASECEQITKNFGGNYEEAAKFMGW